MVIYYLSSIIYYVYLLFLNYDFHCCFGNQIRLCRTKLCSSVLFPFIPSKRKCSNLLKCNLYQISMIKKDQNTGINSAGWVTDYMCGLLNSDLTIDDPKPPGMVQLEENVPGTVTVSWEPSPDEKRDDRLHYMVSRRDSSKKTWSTIADRLFNNKFTACNIMPGSEYHFRVYAKNDMGISEPSHSPVWGTAKKRGLAHAGLLTKRHHKSKALWYYNESRTYLPNFSEYLIFSTGHKDTGYVGVC